MIKHLASHFKLGKDTAHLSVLTYGQSAEIPIKFNDFYSVKAFSNALDKLKPKNGNPRLDKAYQLAAEIMFTEEGGASPGITK